VICEPEIYDAEPLNDTGLPLPSSLSITPWFESVTYTSPDEGPPELSTAV